MKNMVVIPVLNEEKNIIDVLEKTKNNIGKGDRIIVVDNNSTDNTVSLIKERFHDVEIVFEEKGGKGNALRKGFTAAMKYNPDFIIMIDGDGEKDPDDIPKLVSMTQISGVDMIVGCRNISRSFTRELLKRFENFWLRYATGYSIRDGSSGFNVIKAESLKKIKLASSEFEIEPELILECRKKRMRVAEFPVSTPLISPTKVKKGHIILINRFFDKWVLEWIKSNDCNLSSGKKAVLRIFCNLGLLIFR